MGHTIAARVRGPEAAHTSGITTALILAHVETCGGSRAVGDVLARVGMSDCEPELRSERSWWSWDTKIALFEAAAEILDDDAVTYNAGRGALERGVAGPLKAALRALGTPGIVYANIVRANHKFSSVSRMVLEETSGHRVRLRYELIEEGVQANRLDCLYNQGLLSCVPVLFDLPPARIEHSECALRGCDSCVYEVSWSPQIRPGWRTVAGTGMATATAVGATAVLAPALVAASGAAAGATIAWWLGRRRRELAQSVSRLQRDLELHAERTERVRTSLHALSSALSYEELTERVTEHASTALGGIPCALLLNGDGDGDGDARIVTSTGVDSATARALEDWAAITPLESPFILEDSATAVALRGIADVGTACVAPLMSKGKPLGALVALSGRPFSFLPRELSVLELFAEQAAIALVNVRLYAAQLEIATRDPLTGLRNHREFHEVMVNELARSHRTAARFSVALLDLDGFKAVNDRFGHAAGDRLLGEVGAALERVGRSADSAFRIGGDEFALVFPEATAKEADAAARRISQTVSDIDARIGVSWGVATWPEDGKEKDLLLACADERLYAMKRTRAGEPAAAHVEETLVAALAALGEALEAKDSYTAEHAREVAHIVVGVGERLGLDAARDAHAQPRGAASRRRQDRGADRHPQQARETERRGVRDRQDAFGDRVLDGRANPRPGGGCAAGPLGPRALGRRRLPGRAQRRGDPARLAHHRGL